MFEISRKDTVGYPWTLDRDIRLFLSTHNLMYIILSYMLLLFSTSSV